MADINNLIEGYGRLSQDLQQVEQHLTRAFGPEYVQRMRDASYSIHEYEAELDSMLNNLSNKGIGGLLGKVFTLDRETVIKINENFKKIGTESAKEFMGAFESAMNFGLPGIFGKVLGPFAALGGIVNQMSAVSAEGAKMAVQMESAFGRVLPESLNTAIDSAKGMDKQYESIAFRFGKTRQEIDLMREAITSNTLVSGSNFQELNKNTAELTSQMAALSKVSNMPVSTLIENQIKFQKEFNREAGETPKILSAIWSEANKADLASYKLFNSTMTLATSFKYQGANIEEMAKYLGGAVSEMTKYGEAQYNVLDYAQRGMQAMGAKTSQEGMSVLVGQQYLKGLTGKGARTWSEEEATGLKQLAGFLGMQGAESGEQSDILKFIQSKGSLANIWLGQAVGGTQGWRNSAMGWAQGLTGGDSAASMKMVTDVLGVTNFKEFMAVQAGVKAGDKPTRQEQLFENVDKTASNIASETRSYVEWWKGKWNIYTKDFEVLKYAAIVMAGIGAGKAIGAFIPGGGAGGTVTGQVASMYGTAGKVGGLTGTGGLSMGAQGMLVGGAGIAGWSIGSWFDKNVNDKILESSWYKEMGPWGKTLVGTINPLLTLKQASEKVGESFFNLSSKAEAKLGKRGEEQIEDFKRLKLDKQISNDAVINKMVQSMYSMAKKGENIGSEEWRKYYSSQFGEDKAKEAYGYFDQYLPDTNDSVVISIKSATAVPQFLAWAQNKDNYQLGS